MTNPLGRVRSGTLSTASLPPSENPSETSKTTGDSSFLRVVENFPSGLGFISSSGSSTPAAHRQARSRVIEQAVESTLEDPQHPYYSIGSQHREEMRRWILQELESSHFLKQTPSRRG